MAEHARSKETTASPERIWQIWSQPATWQEWNPTVESVRLDGPFAAGTTGTMRTKGGRTHAIRLRDVEPGRSFRLEASAVPLSKFVFRCAVTPGSGGRTTITQGVTMEGPLGPVYSPIMGEQVAKSFEPILNGLAAKAEGRG
jgi:uncharacterized protein YndB with AHSA1/START domain